jgi:hypothetical protein
VSKAKFDQEIANFRAREAEYRSRGWLLLEAEYPRVLVVLCARQLKPQAIITAVFFDYSNYDAQPPSVVLVDPFTGEPYPFGNMPTTLQRQVVGPEIQIPELLGPPGGGVPRVVGQQPLMQAAKPEDIPFLCIAGVREYHEHPAHSGDAWELHRQAGAGRLVRLLEVIDTYGVRPISGYNIELVPRVSGFIQNQVPE